MNLIASHFKCWALVRYSLWPPCIADAEIIFLSCFFLSFFLLFSSPNLSGHRLDVCHTSTHGVAIVQIYNAGLKCGARGSLEMQNPKNRHLGIVAQLCLAVFLQLRHISTIGKKFVRQQYLLHMSPQCGELWPTNSWDRFGSLGYPSTFQRVSHLGSVTVRHSSTWCQPNFAALNRGHHLYLAGRPSRWALAHILVTYNF